MATKNRLPINYDILRKRRQYFIKKVKFPLVRGLVNSLGRGDGFLARILLFRDVWDMVTSVLRYPYPTKENTRRRETHILLDTFDEFERYNTFRPAFFHAAKRFIACTVEHDIDEKQRVTWFLSKLVSKYINGEWPALEPWEPTNGWTEKSTMEAVQVAKKELKDNLIASGLGKV